jgi:hypothetical protein
VHSKIGGLSSNGLSFIEKTLRAGGTVAVNDNVIKFLSTGDGYANIEINGSLPPQPTSAKKKGYKEFIYFEICVYNSESCVILEIYILSYGENTFKIQSVTEENALS